MRSINEVYDGWVTGEMVANASQRCPHLNPRTCKHVTLHFKGDLANIIKDLEMMGIC